MVDYFINNLWQLWAIIAVICLILELTSGDFFIICFSIGALIAVVAAVCGMNFYGQLIIFIIFSVACVFLVRPVALRWFHKNDPNRKSNADALIGQQGIVHEPITDGEYGYVQIAGDLWRAYSTDGKSIAKGTKVCVVSRESTIITVKEL